MPGDEGGGGKGKGGGKGGGGKGKGKGKGRSEGGDPDRPTSAPPGGRGSGGGGSGGGRGGGGAGGKGAPKAKVGDTREMGGVMLVAVDKDGRIAWEPVGGIDSQASRDAQRRAAQDEARWLREQQAAIKDQRVAEAREIERKEKRAALPPAHLWLALTLLDTTWQAAQGADARRGERVPHVQGAGSADAGAQAARGDPTGGGERTQRGHAAERAQAVPGAPVPPPATPARQPTTRGTASDQEAVHRGSSSRSPWTRSNANTRPRRAARPFARPLPLPPPPTPRQPPAQGLQPNSKADI